MLHVGGSLCAFEQNSNSKSVSSNDKMYYALYDVRFQFFRNGTSFNVVQIAQLSEANEFHLGTVLLST